MFFYDSDCGFCVWSLGHLQALTTDLPASPGTGLYIQRNAYFVDSDNRVYLGHKAISLALRRYGRTPLVRLGGLVLGLPVFAPIYRIIVWNRHRLGPLVGADTCTI